MYSHIRYSNATYLEQHYAQLPTAINRRGATLLTPANQLKRTCTVHQMHEQVYVNGIVYNVE